MTTLAITVLMEDGRVIDTRFRTIRDSMTTSGDMRIVADLKKAVECRTEKERAR